MASPPATTDRSRLNAQDDSEKEAVNHAYRNGFIYSMLVITVPLFLYFFSKVFIFEAFLGFSSATSYFYAAIVAVVAVQAVLALFVYMAWLEEQRPRSIKQD